MRLRAILPFLASSLFAVPCHAYDLLDGRLQLYGFIESRAGAWTESNPTRPIIIPGITAQPDDHALAVWRSTLQLEADLRMTEWAELHSVIRLAYEPRYQVDKYANDGSQFGRWRLPRGEYNEPASTSEIFREVWVRADLAPGQSLQIGRQIVNWGESLAFRVADVINPNDGRFSLFFLEPEETRIAQWMLRGYHDFPTLPFSPAIEWVAVAPLDPKQRRVNLLAATGSRFAIPPEERLSRFPAFAGLPALWTVDRAAAKGGAVDFRFLDRNMKDFPSGWRGGLRLRFSLGPADLAIFNWYGYPLLPVVQDDGLLPFVIADYATVLGRPDLSEVYAALGIPPPAQTVIPLNAFRFRYPRQNVLGATGNVYVAPLRSVARFEFTWRKETLQIDGFNHVTGAITDADGLKKSNVIDWQIALDLGGLYWPSLNPTGDFTFNLEYTQHIILDHDDQMRVGVYETRLAELTDTLSLRMSTVYEAATISPSLILIYQPRQRAGAIVASLALAAPWDERLTSELRYAAVLGDNAYNGLGFFRSKDFVMLSIRYGF